MQCIIAMDSQQLYSVAMCHRHTSKCSNPTLFGRVWTHVIQWQAWNSAARSVASPSFVPERQWKTHCVHAAVGCLWLHHVESLPALKVSSCFRLVHVQQVQPQSLVFTAWTQSFIGSDQHVWLWSKVKIGKILIDQVGKERCLVWSMGSWALWFLSAFQISVKTRQVPVFQLSSFHPWYKYGSVFLFRAFVPFQSVSIRFNPFRFEKFTVEQELARAVREVALWHCGAPCASHGSHLGQWKHLRRCHWGATSCATVCHGVPWGDPQGMGKMGTKPWKKPAIFMTTSFVAPW